MEYQSIGVDTDINKHIRHQWDAEEFRAFDHSTISKMSQKELAAWQSGYAAGSPQFILAEHEWLRRLTVEQVKASRFAAFMGLLGAVVGAFLTWMTTK